MQGHQGSNGSMVRFVWGLTIFVLFAACATRSPVGTLRFANRPPVWLVNDRMHVAQKPKKQSFSLMLYGFDRSVTRALTRMMDVPAAERAKNTNSLDEVPDSTWFQNRIGRYPLTVEQMRRGPNADGGPGAHKPWTILGTKVGGASIGFIMKDARGVQYLLKFDEKGVPEMETAADVIVQRFLWACGYNVPEDYIVSFHEQDLVLARDAVVKDSFGHVRSMKPKDLRDRLKRINRVANEPIRGLVSRFVSGVPIGGFPAEGVREDDPNDIVPHQHRRDIRGLQPIAAWLGHVDMKVDNTMDAWGPDPDDPKTYYVTHYQVDFGKSLGTMGWTNRFRASGFAHTFDRTDLFGSLLSFGLWKRPWEKAQAPGIHGIGLFSSSHFDPGDFATAIPYPPFHETDRFDGFWGAKILIRFSPEQIRAVVELGQYTDPRAVEYLTQTLVERQRKTAQYWFSQVAPLDNFEVIQQQKAYKVCFEDLMISYGLSTNSRPVRYFATAYDYTGRRRLWRQTVGPDPDGRSCVSKVPQGPSHEGYVIIQFVKTIAGKSVGSVLVHLALEPATQVLRIIGIRRR